MVRFLKAYRWLPQHPVTLQRTFSADEGHSHVAQGQEEEWTGVEAGWPLSLCSWGELFPWDQTSSEWWEKLWAFNPIWSNRRLEKKCEGCICLCFCHAPYPQTSNIFPYLMILFPCWESLYDRFPQSASTFRLISRAVGKVQVEIWILKIEEKCHSHSWKKLLLWVKKKPPTWIWMTHFTQKRLIHFLFSLHGRPFLQASNKNANTPMSCIFYRHLSHNHLHPPLGNWLLVLEKCVDN